MARGSVPRDRKIGVWVKGHGPRLGAWIKASNFLPFVYTYTHDHFYVSWLTAHGPRLGALDSWLKAHAPRLGAWLKATNFLPFAHRARAKHFHFEAVANPTAHGSGVRTPGSEDWRVGKGSWPAARGMDQGFQFPSLCLYIHS